MTLDVACDVSFTKAMTARNITTRHPEKKKKKMVPKNTGRRGFNLRTIIIALASCEAAAKKRDYRMENSSQSKMSMKSMVMDRNDKNDLHFRGDFTMEDSPSYETLNAHNLLTKKYRIASEADLELVPPNSSRWANTAICCLTCPIGCVYNGFEVPNGTIKLGYDGKGGYFFLGPGVHQMIDPYVTIKRGVVPVTTSTIVNGDRTIVTVDQGFIGYCMERGQPVMLPPGMHQWRSATLQFLRLIDLNQPVIELGPWTLLTIDQGYMAVTQDNGEQVILDGGSVYLLTHRNWKFEKFVSTKIQTNELRRIEAASADNVIMLVDATVLWRISDVETAVRMSAETMSSDGKKTPQTIEKLRNDVLKQAEASLAFFVGTINFSDSMAAAAMNQRSKTTSGEFPVAVAEREPQPTGQTPPVVEFNLYNNDKLDDAVSHANEITSTYGVEIISINIISAIPGDKKLQVRFHLCLFAEGTLDCIHF
jgi:ribosomal protein S30